MTDTTHEANVEAYWNDIIHLKRLGFIEETPDGKGVILTPKGRMYWIQSNRLANKEDRP